MFLLSFLKKTFFYVFTKILIPKPKFGPGFSHSVCISAAMSEEKIYKTVIIIQFTIIEYTCMY